MLTEIVPPGTFVGCVPNNFLAVNAGNKLGELKAFTDLYDAKILLVGEQSGSKHFNSHLLKSCSLLAPLWSLLCCLCYVHLLQQHFKEVPLNMLILMDLR